MGEENLGWPKDNWGNAEETEAVAQLLRNAASNAIIDVTTDPGENKDGFIWVKMVNARPDSVSELISMLYFDPPLLKLERIQLLTKNRAVLWLTLNMKVFHVVFNLEETTDETATAILVRLAREEEIIGKRLEQAKTVHIEGLDLSLRELMFLKEHFGEMLEGSGDEDYKQNLESIYNKAKRALENSQPGPVE